ncbi:MAG: MBL fold metallo-hydrolase [Alphaproteobacteria bacterium]|nr:MBL fold metallo-hydrolase [Alphaproteobacteria bacterium]
MKITILGCGGSGGVPLIGDHWGVCDPNEPRNRRLRPSIVVQWQGKTILVDTTPDLRTQLLAAGIGAIDAVLYTHAHADHVHGIDDLRSVWRVTRSTIDVYAEADVLRSVVERFAYMFPGRGSADSFYAPILVPHVIEGPFRAAGLPIVPFRQDHGLGPSTGFRFGPFAYSTDVVQLPEEAFAALAGITTWVVDCLRPGNPHPTHAHLDRTLAWIERVGPARAFLTHLNHQADYATVAGLCPPGVVPAHDGLVIEVAEAASAVGLDAPAAAR